MCSIKFQMLGVCQQCCCSCFPQLFTSGCCAELCCCGGINVSTSARTTISVAVGKQSHIYKVVTRTTKTTNNNEYNSKEIITITTRAARVITRIVAVQTKAEVGFFFSIY